MRRFLWVVPLALLLAVLTSTAVLAQDATPAPAGEATPEPAPRLQSEAFLNDDSLLTGEPCAAPCWRGITPGETAWEEAISILEADETLGDIRTQQSESSAALAADFGEVEGDICCQLFSEGGATVEVLFLRFVPGTTLGDVIEVHGEPTYLIGSPFSEDQAIMNLLYPDVPMVLYAFVEGTTGALSEDSPILGVLYTTPGEMESVLRTSALHAWEGYATYQDYESGVYELTPDPAFTPEAAGL